MKLNKRHQAILENLVHNEIADLNNDEFRDEKYFEELYDLSEIIEERNNIEIFLAEKEDKK